jgi:hypothetical protein
VNPANQPSREVPTEVVMNAERNLPNKHLVAAQVECPLKVQPSLRVSFDVYANSDLGQKLEAVRKLEAMVIQ